MATCWPGPRGRAEQGAPHLGDGVAVVAGLLEAGVELRGRGGFQNPFEVEGDACRGVVETGGAWLARADDVAEEVFLADVDAEEKARRGCGVCGSFHGAFGCPQRMPETTPGRRVTVSSKQIRDDLRCCSDFGAGRAAWCLILFTDSSVWSGGLSGTSDCTMRPFWVPFMERSL